jgi:hypothetical protein
VTHIPSPNIVTSSVPLTAKPKANAITDVKPLEIAKQLTLIDFHMYRKITPKELSHQAWNKENAKELAPHVVQLISRINDVSNFMNLERPIANE